MENDAWGDSGPIFGRSLERPRRGARYWAVRVLRLALVSYIAVLAFLYFAQTALIFPGRESQGQPWAHVTPPRGAVLVHLDTAGGDRVVALFGPALTADGQPMPDAARRPTILFFYGNGDHLSANVDNLEDLRRTGSNVLIPEYVGYGLSTGEAGEAGCYATSDAAYEYLLTRDDVDPKRIVVAGWSLGAAVAIDTAARRPVAGLATFSGFTSLSDMGRLSYPFIPVSWLLKHKFESEQKIARVSCPVLIGHGKADAFIPFTMSDRLAAAAKGPVTRVAIEGANHNDFFLVGGHTVMDAVRAFVEPL